MNRSSLGFPPVHGSINKSAISSQNKHPLNYWNNIVCCFHVQSIGIIARTENTKAKILSS